MSPVRHRTLGSSSTIGRRILEIPPDPMEQQQQQLFNEHVQALIAHWQQHPVHYVCDVLNVQPDPWSCDLLDCLADPSPEMENIALKACHGVGKTFTLGCAILWFTTTYPLCKMPTTAPTYNKQVRDVMWGEVHRLFRTAEANQRTPEARWLMEKFKLTTTRLESRENPGEWFAVGIASSEPLNIEGYHAPYLLAIFDEAKGVKPPIWESVQGMRTTQQAKLLVASTPGGLVGEFYKVFTKYRTTWKTLFEIHPRALQQTIKRPEAPPFSHGGVYYSDRIRQSWIDQMGEMWGSDSPAYIARVIGNFPTLLGDELVPYGWLVDAEEQEDWLRSETRTVACDVARHGRDRTVITVWEGGNLLYGETIARTVAESMSPTARGEDVGDDPRHARYRATDATGDACRRIRQTWGASVICIDDTGVGGGVTDYLKRKGERVIPIVFGASPTDRPKDADTRESKLRKTGGLDTRWLNLKAQMGWALRRGFEMGNISLANVVGPDGKEATAFREQLIVQTSMIKVDYDSAGRMKLIDPDEQDELAKAAGQLEGKRSPDHFHSMLMGWWIASGEGSMIVPKAGRPLEIPGGIHRLGRSSGALGQAVPNAPKASKTAAQAGYVRRAY